MAVDAGRTLLIQAIMRGEGSALSNQPVCNFIAARGGVVQHRTWFFSDVEIVMSWLPKQRVLVPIDFSGKSVEALNTALEFVESPDHIDAVHVVPPLDNMAPGVDWGVVDDKSRRESIVKHFSEFLTEHGVSGVNTVVLLGDPGSEIAEYAVEHHVDLIVIPSHGYHGMKRMVLGSVAERVIRYAECPVLVLRRADAE